MVRIGPRKVVDNTRSPEREALRSAIANHAKLRAEIEVNVVAQRRAEDAKLDAIRAAEKAQERLEEARAKDAHALAHGEPGGAVKVARAQLQECEDTVAAFRAATSSLLPEEAGDITNRMALSSSRVNEAVAAVVRGSAEAQALIEKFRGAQLALHEASEAMRVLMSNYPDASNATWWEQSGFPSHVRFWDAVNWEKDLPPSATAARVKVWIERLRTDADATARD